MQAITIAHSLCFHFWVHFRIALRNHFAQEASVAAARAYKAEMARLQVALRTPFPDRPEDDACANPLATRAAKIDMDNSFATHSKPRNFSHWLPIT